MEESRSLLDSAERNKRQLEMELGDARNSVNEMQTINNKEMTIKRACEGSLHTIQAEIDATTQVNKMEIIVLKQKDGRTKILCI